MADDPIDTGLPPDDEIATATAESPKPPPQNGNGSHPETITESVRKAREMIPVGDRGITPTTYAQWIDVAKDVCKAYLMLPTHLHNNPPVMAGLLEIAARFKLSPYMLASKTYVQNNRLCFEAQAFGAILYASGLLQGRLSYQFHGEAEDMTCTVSGRFKDDPGMVYSATTPSLKQLHPGVTTKEKDGVKQTFVKGSPLWDKDPEQQMAYFALRRWTRRFAPDCVAGMYTREEIEELDTYRMGRGESVPLEADRLGQLETGEGWAGGGHVDMDLAAIAPEEPDWDVAEPGPEEPEPPPSGGRKPPRPAQRKPAQRPKPVVRPKVAPASKTRPGKPAKPGRTFRGRPPTRAVVTAAVKRAELPPRRVVAQPPKWLDYVADSEAWIKSVNDTERADKAEARWETERDLRDRLQVPMGERSRLRAQLDRKLAQFKPKPKETEE